MSGSLSTRNTPEQRVGSSNYFLEPLSKEDLVALLKKGGLGPRDLLRTREKSYKEMGLADPNLDDDMILDALVAEPGYSNVRSLSGRGGLLLAAR